MADGKDIKRVVRPMVFDNLGDNSNVGPLVVRELFDKHYRTDKTKHNASRVFDFEEITTDPCEQEYYRGVMKFEEHKPAHSHVADSNPIAKGITVAMEDESVDETDPFRGSTTAKDDTNEASLANELAMEVEKIAKTDPTLPSTMSEDDTNEVSAREASEMRTFPPKIDIEPDRQPQNSPDGHLSDKEDDCVEETEPMAFSEKADDVTDKISVSKASETSTFPKTEDIPILICKPDFQQQIEPKDRVVEARDPASAKNHFVDTKATPFYEGHENGTSGLDEVQRSIPNIVQVGVALKIENQAFKFGKKKAPALNATLERSKLSSIGERIADQANNRRPRGRKKRPIQGMKGDVSQEGGARKARPKKRPIQKMKDEATHEGGAREARPKKRPIQEMKDEATQEEGIRKARQKKLPIQEMKDEVTQERGALNARQKKRPIQEMKDEVTQERGALNTRQKKRPIQEMKDEATQERVARKARQKKLPIQEMTDEATREEGARKVRRKIATDTGEDGEMTAPFNSAPAREASHRALAKIAVVHYAEAVADVDGRSVEDGEESIDDVSISESKESSEGTHILITPNISLTTGPGDLTILAKRQQSTVSNSSQAANKILLGRDDVITSRGGSHAGTKRFHVLLQKYATNSLLSSVKDVTAWIKRDIRSGRFLHKHNNLWCLSSDDEISMKIKQAWKNAKRVISSSLVTPQSAKRKSTRPTGPRHDSTARAQTAPPSLVSPKLIMDSLEEVSLHDNDVLCGDDNHTRKGNLQYLKIVKRLASKLKPDSDLTGVVKQVEDGIAPGRFIRQEGEVFIPLEEDQRRAKIIEALQYSAESRFGGTKSAVGTLQMLPSQSSLSSNVSNEEPVPARIKRGSKKQQECRKTFDDLGTTTFTQVAGCNREGSGFSPLVENQDHPPSIDAHQRSAESRFDGKNGVASINDELVPDTDLRSKTDREKLSEKDDDALFQTYVEDVAWRKYAVDSTGMEDISLSPLPPPDPLPELPTDDPSCTWTFDEETRILRATLKPNMESFSPAAKKHLFLMMERDDIAIITGGHCRNLDASLWNSECIKSKSGERYHHRFRRFRRRNDDDTGIVVDDTERNLRCEYEEVDKDLTMSVNDYFNYLEKRQEFFRMSSEARQAVDRQFHYVNDVGEDASVDLDEVVYMLDYDIKKKLPSHFEDFKDNFCFPEILPGGQMCAMNTVNEAARPDMGPNMYVTPPGSFTKFHQDGYGTVDSGHLCLSGYNEVIIMRRLPRGHDRNAINGDRNNFYEMPHADLSTKTTFEWPKKAQIQHMNMMNYCAIILVLGPGEHLHIGKGRFHAFRKLGPEMLPEDDCHFDLRKQVHCHLEKEKVVIDDLVNISLAWDWSFLGETPEGINREMTSTLEFALRNRAFLKPKQSLAIPKLSLLSRCESSIAALRTQGKTFGISTFANIQSISRHRNIIKGLLPTLEFVVAQEEEAYMKAQISGTSTLTKNAKPHSWENPVLFPLDPYGNSDYFCRICFQELSNTYMHCDGCEELLKKDFNICADCHSDSKHCQFFIMSEKYDSMDSALNHTGAILKKSHKICDCIGKDPCVNCGKCRQYSCTCHQKFTLHQRMWKCEKLFEIRAMANDIVAGDNIKFFDEVQPRLREARLSVEIPDKARTQRQRTARKSTVDELTFAPYTFTGIASSPVDHLDISAEALAFTTPFLCAERPSFTTSFSINVSAHELYDLITKARESSITDAMSLIVGDIGIERERSVQLLRNFYDCEILGYSSSTHIAFAPREVDIMAYAIMQAVANVPCPTKVRLGNNLRTSWGHAAWRLMPYRVRKDITDRFSFRAATNNLEDKFADALANEEYRTYLESKVALLFLASLAT